MKKTRKNGAHDCTKDHQMDKLREELRKRIAWDSLEPSRRLQALADLVPVLEMEPSRFHRLWIQPLLDAGLTLEAAVACIAESHFHSN